MPTVPVADATLFYEEQGAGDPLVWAHGGTGTAEVSWAPLWTNGLAALAERYRVLAPDERGHGRSTGAPATIRPDRFAADLVALLDHLGLDRAHFVGHSAGAWALLVLGTRSLPRVRSLTLLGGGHTWDEGVRARLRALLDSLPAQPGWIADQRRLHDATHGADHWQVLLDTFRGWADDPALLPFQPGDVGAITRPVLVLHGDRDPMFPVESATALYRALPNAELAVLPRAGHGPHWDRPALVVRLLGDFLARHADA
jgi:pimeloyl-ACP methyl ester carboxylesterase